MPNVNQTRDARTEIEQILSDLANRTWNSLTDVLSERGVDVAREMAYDWQRRHDAGRSISRSTSMISNMVGDVERAAAFNWLHELDDAIKFAEDDCTVEYLVQRMQNTRHRSIY